MNIRHLFVLISVFSFCSVYSQNGIFSDTVSYSKWKLSKKEIYEKFVEKLNKIPATDTLKFAATEDKDVFSGKGLFLYNHNINFDTTDAFLNKTYVGQVHGAIHYNVKIEFQKKFLVVTVSDFNHIAKGTRYGKRSLGKNIYTKPILAKDEESVWQEKVRKDMLDYCDRFNVRFKLWFMVNLI